MSRQVSKGGRISVIVADDHEVVRVGLRALLASQENIELIGEAASGREAVARAKELRPEIVIMDLAMPLLNGVEATRQILHDCPTIKVIALSSYGDREHVRQAMAAGARGYMLKGMAPKDLIAALYEVHEGRQYLSPVIAEELSSEEMRSEVFANEQSETNLSIREAEVLQLIAEGMTNKGIADELSLSIKTIEKHRHALMGKLDMHNVADLVRYAVSKKAIEGGCIEESQVDG
jgi:DNA-binding NarL/FixJ family response regulator